MVFPSMSRGRWQDWTRSLFGLAPWPPLLEVVLHSIATCEDFAFVDIDFDAANLALNAAVDGSGLFPKDSRLRRCRWLASIIVHAGHSLRHAFGPLPVGSRLSRSLSYLRCLRSSVWWRLVAESTLIAKR